MTTVRSQFLDPVPAYYWALLKKCQIMEELRQGKRFELTIFFGDRLFVIGTVSLQFALF